MKKTKKMTRAKTTEVAIFNGSMPTLSTVNVIEFADEEILGLTAFPDTEEGNRNAEIRFHDIIKRNWDEELEEVIEAAIEDGIYENGNKNGTFKVNLTHSS